MSPRLRENIEHLGMIGVTLTAMFINLSAGHRFNDMCAGWLGHQCVLQVRTWWRLP